MSMTELTVLITGAARGIGEGLAREVVRRGGRVALVGLEPERLAALAHELGEAADWHEADVADLDGMRAAATWAVERFGGIDVVVANAGIARVGTVAEIEPADFDRVIEVNLLGVWRTVRATLPAVAARRGHVLLISSMSAAVRLPLMSAYAASKAAVSAFGDALRIEAASDGVTVGTAYLSFVDTDMVRDSFADEIARPFLETTPRWLLATMPLDQVVRKLADAVERRATRVVLPRYALPMLLCSHALEPLVRRFVLSRRRRLGEPVARDRS